MPADPTPAPAAAGYLPLEPRGAPVVGVLLAAGAGTRMGRPKALVRDLDDGEPWLHHGVRVLLEGGCDHALVVLGAESDAATALLREYNTPAPVGRVSTVVASDWADGISASLRAGLIGADALHAAVVVVTLVDLPDLQPAAVARILSGATSASLRQAHYAPRSRPGHPVLIGAAHLEPLIATVQGDTGARAYLRAHDAVAVDCSGLGGDLDVDHA